MQLSRSISSPVLTLEPDGGWFLVRRCNRSLSCDRTHGSQPVQGHVAIHPLEYRRECFWGQVVAVSQPQAAHQLLTGLVGASGRGYLRVIGRGIKLVTEKSSPVGSVKSICVTIYK